VTELASKTNIEVARQTYAEPAKYKYAIPSGFRWAGTTILGVGTLWAIHSKSSNIYELVAGLVASAVLVGIYRFVFDAKRG
jgi:hypothetical protein